MAGCIEYEKERYGAGNWNRCYCTYYAAHHADDQDRRRKSNSDYAGWKSVWYLLVGKESGDRSERWFLL